MGKVKSEDAAVYASPTINSGISNIDEDALIVRALNILSDRISRTGDAFTCPEDARKYCTLQLAEREHEIFACLFLNNRHQLIRYSEIFRGTIDGASVYPREVVKEALKVNAAAVIFVHNHPSGNPEPSEADKRITARLKDALALVDIKTLDHIVVGGVETYSFADRGLI